MNRDLVDREAVKEVINTWIHDYRILLMIQNSDIMPLIEAIHDLPTVKPEE